MLTRMGEGMIQLRIGETSSVMCSGQRQKGGLTAGEFIQARAHSNSLPIVIPIRRRAQRVTNSGIESTLRVVSTKTFSRCLSHRMDPTTIAEASTSCHPDH